MRLLRDHCDDGGTAVMVTSWTNRAVDGLAVSVPVLFGAALVGVATSVGSSWFTARSVGRTPVAAALTGRRPPRTSSGRLLVAGAVNAVLGIALTVATASGAASGTSELLTALGLLAGAALTMIGLGAMSPWLVEQISDRMGTRFPVASDSRCATPHGSAPAPVPFINQLRHAVPVTAAAPLTIIQPVDPTWECQPDLAPP